MSAPDIPQAPLHDRLIVAGALGVIAAIAWIYLLRLDANMSTSMPMDMDMDMPMDMGIQPRTFADHLMTFVMWSAMMVAMMVPSAAPFFLLFVGVYRKQQPAPKVWRATAALVLGYLAVWWGFSLLATIAQALLEQAALLSPGLVDVSPKIAGTVMAVSGVYQLTPLKDTCLAHCRTPFSFVTQHWKPGIFGAFQMGVLHGAFCLGCCWLLMALLFVAGTMNLLAAAAIAIFVLIEKVTPFGEIVSRVAGLALVAGGAALIAFA